ncbi:hypothetical protein Tco_0535920 [Tanacetum coccineum]
MVATKSFEDRLIEVEKKLEECFTRFIKMEECVTQMHQEFSLWSDKLFKSVEAAEKEKKSKLIQATVKEKKNQENQVHSYGLQQNRCYKRRMEAKLFWKKFVVASQPTKKLWISLDKYEGWQTTFLHLAVSPSEVTPQTLPSSSNSTWFGLAMDKANMNLCGQFKRATEPNIKEGAYSVVALLIMCSLGIS